MKSLLLFRSLALGGILVVTHAMAPVAHAANPQLWQLTFTYSDAGLVLHKAAQIPPLAKRVQTPGLQDAPLRLEYDLEWQDAAGQLAMVVPVVMPIGSRAALGAAGAEAHQEKILPEGAVVVRVEGPADAKKVARLRLLKRAAIRSALVPPEETLVAPGAFSAGEQSFDLARATAKIAMIPGPVAATKVRNTGSDSNRLVVVFLGDGFTEANLTAGAFANKVSSFLSVFLGVKPWNLYSQLVNAYRVDIISNQSGADYEDASPAAGGTMKDTYLNSAFWQGGTERLLTLTGNGSSRTYDAADAFVGVGVWDKIMVFVNSTKYGGSGGSIAVSSVNSSADEIQIHEFGHSYPGLADEYDFGSTGTNCVATSAPNADCSNNFPHVKWDAWVTPGAPIPTPNASSNSAIIGAFEGAVYQLKGMYRPKYNCRMRSLGAAFCEICVEAHITSLLRQVRILDVSDPRLGQAEVPSYGSRLFRVTPLSIGGMQYAWYLNGMLLSSTTTSVSIASGDLTGFNDQLRLDITHSTTNVRSQVMSQSNVWNLASATQPTLAIANASTLEDNPALLRIPLTLSFPHNETVNVSFGISDGTALAGEDYVATNGVLTFAPGQTSNSISVRVLSDRNIEAHEFFFINLCDVTNAILARSQASAQIVDDDHPPVVAITYPSNNVALFTSNVAVSASTADFGGTVTNLAIYLDGALVNQAVASTLAINMTNLANGPHVLTAEARNSFGLEATSAPVTIIVLAPATRQSGLVSITNVWRFDATTNDYGTAWKEFSFIDAAWDGPSNALFYNETATLPAAKNTPLALTNGARLRTYYFRTHFTAPTNPGSDLFLVVSNLIDDGAVFWLNGSELGRLRVTNTVVVRTNLASGTPPNGGDATAFEALTLPATSLQPGDNVLAVEVHQQADSSTDVVFGMSLDLMPGARPVFLDPASPADATVLEGRSVTLSATAAGNPAPAWQWFRNDAAVNDATNLSLLLSNVTSANAGAYFVRASNLLGVATSQVATVSLVSDAFPPALVAALGSFNLTSIVVSFSEPLDAASATTISNYRVSPLDGGTTGGVLGASLLLRTNVVLTTTVRTPGANYLLTASNVRDLFANTIAPESQMVIAAEAIVVAGDNQTWRYFQSNAAPAYGWMAPGFDDSTWPAGAALFDANRPAGRTVVGPSNAPVRTVLSLTNPTTAASQTLSYYFRIIFTLSGSPTGTRLWVRTFVDDGAVFYLNGQEVYRLRMAAQPAAISYTNLATLTQHDTDNIYEAPFEIPSSALLPGANLLAVEVHQAAASSSDVSFAAQLTAQLGWSGFAEPAISINRSGSSALLRWYHPDAQLETSGSLFGGWTNVPSATSPWPVGTGEPTKYFRLRVE